MTGRERFLTALRREQADRVPIWELIINEPTLSALYGNIGYFSLAEKLDLDAVTVFENHRSKDLGGGFFKDEWGIVWGVEECGVSYPAGHPIQDKRDLDSYTPPDPHADYRLDTLRDAVRRFKGEKAVVLCGHEAFEFSHYLLGLENLFAAYIEDPEFVHRLARMIIDYKKAVLDRAIDEGLDVVVCGDDYAYRTAPLMSPAFFQEFCVPYMKEMVEVAHRRGIPHIKHTDGNIWPILDMIVETGTDAIDPMEPIAGMDVGEVKAKYGDRVAVVGNVDCTEILTHGSREDVIEAVKETIAKASVGGGHIIASSNSIHPGVRPENYLTMVESAKQFGAYPLDEKMVAEYRTRSYVLRLLR
jgi:uroporphyrinogen decarboxylase